jgi:hypothetical protein
MKHVLYAMLGVVVVIALDVSGSTIHAQQQEVVLRCFWVDSIIISRNKPWPEVYALAGGKARLMSVDPPRSGTVATSDSGYTLFFPDREFPSLQIKVEINRFTGQAFRTLGGFTLTFEGGQERIPPITAHGKCGPYQLTDRL